jgi:hypothetical protein
MMADENEQLDEDLFPELEELDEEVEVEEENQPSKGNGARTLNEAERSGGAVSDFKMALRTIVPDWLDNDIEELETLKRAIMVSNIPYDAVIPQMQLTINNIVMRHARDGIDNEKAPVNPMLIYNICHGIFFPAIQGRRTIDILELYGSAGETSESTKEAATRFGF